MHHIDGRRVDGRRVDGHRGTGWMILRNNADVFPEIFPQEAWLTAWIVLG